MKKLIQFLISLSLTIGISLCNNPYGKELVFDKTQVFYTSNVSEKEANKFGIYLIKSEFTDGTAKSVQLDKKSDTYLFRFVMKKEFEKDPSFVRLSRIMGLELSNNVFNGSLVEVHWCDKQFNTFKVVPMMKNLGKNKVFNGT